MQIIYSMFHILYYPYKYKILSILYSTILYILYSF